MALDDSEMDDDDDGDDEEDSEDEEGTDMESDLEGKKEEGETLSPPGTDSGVFKARFNIVCIILLRASQ